MIYLTYLFSLFISHQAHGACAFQPSSVQNLKNIATQQKLNECEEAKKEPECKQLYKMISEDGGDLKSKERDCKLESTDQFSKADQWVIGCLWDNTLGALGDAYLADKKRLADTAAQLAACNGDPKIKAAIYSGYNDAVPTLLQVKEPPPEKLLSSTCEQLTKDLYYAKRVRERYVGLHVEYNSETRPEPFTEQEKEYLAWKRARDQSLNPIHSGSASDQGLLDKAYNKLGEFGVRLECYNSRAAAELACETISLIAGGYGLGRAAVFAGVRAARLTVKIADLKSIGREARIAKAETEIATLSDSEKLSQLNQELGRSKPLNEKAIAAYEKSHQYRSNQNETYGSYLGDTLREKKRILVEEGGFSEKEADFMILRGYVGFSRQDVVKSTFDMGTKFFAKMDYKKAEAIVRYRESLIGTSVKKEQAISEMKAAGMSDSDITAVKDGTFFSGKPRAVASTPTVPAAKPAPVPSQAPAPPPATAPTVQAPPTIPAKPSIVYPRSPPDVLEKASIAGKMTEKEGKAYLDYLTQGRFPKNINNMPPSARAEIVQAAIYNQVDEVTEKAYELKIAFQKPNLKPEELARAEQRFRIAQARCRGLVAFTLAVGYTGERFQEEVARRMKKCEE